MRKVRFAADQIGLWTYTTISDNQQLHGKAGRFAVFIPLCCRARLVPGGEPSSLRLQRVVIDDNPPNNPWIKIVGELEGDGKPDLVIGGRTVAELVTTARKTGGVDDANLN